MKPVTVFTATGSVGCHVVSGLSEAEVPVRAVTRDVSRARTLFDSENLAIDGVEFLQLDLTDRTAVASAVEGSGQVYLASNDSPEQVETEVTIAEASLEAGATHIVKLSSCDAAPDALFSWARHHAAIEQRIAALTTDFSFLRPHYFMQNLFSFADEIESTGAISLPAGDGRIAMIDACDIAAVAVALLVPGTPIRRTAELTGPEPVSFATVAAAISAATGADANYRPCTEQEFLSNPYGEPSPEIARVYRDVADGVLDVRTDEVEAISGQRPRSVEQFAKDYADRFKAS